MAFLTEDRKETGCFLILDVLENMQMAVLGQRFVSAGFVRQGAATSECESMRNALRVKTPDLAERIEIGPKDIAAGQAVVVRRAVEGKSTTPLEKVATDMPALLEEIQDGLFQQAEAFRSTHTRQVGSWDEFKEFMAAGGFAVCGWDGDPASEAAIKEETRATIRLILHDQDPAGNTCIYSGQPARHMVVLARAY